MARLSLFASLLPFLAATLIVAAGCSSDGDSTAADSSVSVHDAHDAHGSSPGKAWRRLGIVFSEPSGPIVSGKGIPVRVTVHGKPDETLIVRLLGSDGVESAAFAHKHKVRLDGEGRGVVDAVVRVPAPTGCSVIAQVTREDGRTEEAHCTLGGKAPRVTDTVKTQTDKGKDAGSGRSVRVSPSAQ